MKGHYKTLGVNEDASPEEIKREFRRRAAGAHPDKQSGDHAKMAELNHAYETLIDPQRRSEEIILRGAAPSALYLGQLGQYGTSST